MGVEILNSARAALEAVRNTRLDPTRKIYFADGMHAQEVGTIRPRELRRSYFGSHRAYPGLERNSFDFGGDATFEELPWWLNLHVKALAAGTAGGVGNEAAITWDFTPSASADDQKSATIQFDLDGPQLFEVPGCLGDELTLTYRKGEEVKFSSKLLTARGATQIGAFTGVGPDRALTTALGTATTVFVDPTTIGTTADDVEEATFKLSNRYAHRDALDGTRLAKEMKRPQPLDWTLDVSRYFASVAELNAYLAKTARKVRVRTDGPVIAGTAGSIARRVDLDCYGVWDKHTWAKVDGMIYARMTLVPLYDTTAATDYRLTVINDVASVS